MIQRESNLRDPYDVTRRHAYGDVSLVLTGLWKRYTSIGILESAFILTELRCEREAKQNVLLIVSGFCLLLALTSVAIQLQWKNDFWMIFWSFLVFSLLTLVAALFCLRKSSEEKSHELTVQKFISVHDEFVTAANAQWHKNWSTFSFEQYKAIAEDALAFAACRVRQIEIANEGIPETHSWQLKRNAAATFEHLFTTLSQFGLIEPSKGYRPFYDKAEVLLTPPPAEKPNKGDPRESIS